ncbi:helix-turn-helix domain-containing protein [Ralstonia mannitolilytica]|uniref:helix-turn-helix domain-containing protein n=1 Tax=Ralstonia mannitolilytica TaxID=105219 RepID=UPI000CEE2F65|nr:helix-turn-helix domain-containing protein [Ralstonia mannitolilytica]
MEVGIVKGFNPSRGFGFIASEAGGDDLFADFSEVLRDSVKSLEDGQRVTFVRGAGQRGATATEIQVIRASCSLAPLSATSSPGATSHAADVVMRPASMPLGLTAIADLACIDSVTSSMRMVKNGAALYRENDPFRSIYPIHAGSFKTTIMGRDGHTQITGFHLVGDTLGLDGVSTNHHNCEVIAIEDSCVRIIPFDLLEHLCSEVKSIRRLVHQVMSNEIARQAELLLLLGTMSVEQRLAAFLLNMSGRHGARGYSPVEFNLRMSRGEIGSYLGVTLEAVSRTFSKFQLNGFIAVQGRRIHILNIASLSDL